MSKPPWSTVIDRLRPHRGPILLALLLVNTELIALALYHLVAPVTITQLAVLVIPFIWINVALWAVWRVDLPPANRRRRLVAGLIAIGYLLVLGYLGGLYGSGIGARATGLRVSTVLPPGWGPALLYSGEYVRFALVPFKVGGYLTLAFLIYVTVLDTARGVAAGMLGLFSCVSCTLPLIAAALSGLVGGGGAIVGLVSAQSYRLSTVVFVVTVLLLVWRPSIGSVTISRIAGRFE